MKLFSLIVSVLAILLSIASLVINKDTEKIQKETRALNLENLCMGIGQARILDENGNVICDSFTKGATHG